jgi:hypothetical protein
VIDPRQKFKAIESMILTIRPKRRKTMSRISLKKPISILILMLFAISMATVTISQAAEPAKVVQGTIVSIDPVSGMLEVQSEEGKTVMLKAGSQTNDLKALQKGDQVTIQYGKDQVIQSINKEK